MLFVFRQLSWCFLFVGLILFLEVPVGGAADFCVSDVTGLESALATAASNDESDTIKIQEGVYLTTSELVVGSAQDQNVALIGGYDVGCSGRRTKPSMTVLDGQGDHRVLTVLMTSGQFWFEGLTVRNGNAALNGGGMVAGNLSGGTIDVVIRHNIFHDNQAGSFGGAFSGGSDLGTFEMTNNLIFGNNASNYGAAMVTLNGSSPSAILSNTVVDNTGLKGIRVWASDAPTVIANNIFWGHQTADLTLTSSGLILENNCYQALDGTPGTSAGNTTDDPLFVGSGNYRLRPVSPLIDAGTDTPSGGSLPLFDLDGSPRPNGSAIDIGAYEDWSLFADGFESGDSLAWH